MALLIHNDPAGLDAHGCKGVGVGYAADASYYEQCREHIRNSVALQLSPHFNVTTMRRMGRQVASDEASFLTWGAMDEMGVYLGGDNSHAVARTHFGAPGRQGSLLDGERHEVNVMYGGGIMQIKIDGEAVPSLTTRVNFTSAGAHDAAGNAWVGFTASTGITSLDTDLLSFSFCSSPRTCGATHH